MSNAAPTSEPPHGDRIASSPAARPAVQQNVFARIQALFPLQTNTVSPQCKSAPPKFHERPPTFLKVRILTWNMHDTVPKGDLTDLLGPISPHRPLNPSSGEPTLPRLENTPSHPYHLVVVAGQECPTMSGIPKVLGSVKLIDKDKDPVREVERDRSHPGREKEKDDILHKWKHLNDSHESLGHQHTGWTAMVENWLCLTTGPFARANASPSSETDFTSSPEIPSTTVCAQDTSKNDAPKGPYQLLIKERLMGIYLAIYIHRDIRELVQGTSKGSVAAGLMGGRVGNKGGVGISLNLNGTTFLFINAHLAAHGGKQNHRLANLAKINAELSVETFLKPDDPRSVAEDITDRFDYTFFCGDLNFRLDISRLHADWLIGRQEYAKALAFDQLRQLMQKREAFVGFKEAQIDFPPTFKYDVLRTIKGRRSHKHLGWKHHLDRSNNLIIEVPEHGNEELEDEGAEDDVASISSSTITSTSKVDVSGEEDYFQVPPSSSVNTPSGRISFAIAANRAKAKWLELLSPTSPRNIFRLGQPRTPRTPHTSRTPMPRTPNWSQNVPAPLQTPTPDSVPTRDTEPHPPPSDTSLGSIANVHNHGAQEDQAESKGVYDSSRKQRVPSWCDRILWKSTVEPGPDHAGVEELPRRSSTLFGQLFAIARRPLSARGRTSHALVTSSDLGSASLVTEMDPQLSPPDVTESRAETVLAPIDNSTLLPPIGLRHSHSNEDMSEKKPHSAKRPVRERDRSRRATLGVYPDETVKSAGLPNRTSTRYASLPTPFRWRFLPFLSRDSNNTLSTEPSNQLEQPSPRRGDVICLSYDTLDDQAMGRLEGRSDHRPVIGSYAVYI